MRQLGSFRHLHWPRPFKLAIASSLSSAQGSVAGRATSGRADGARGGWVSSQNWRAIPIGSMLFLAHHSTYLPDWCSSR